MIELYEGVPGSGKSYHAICEKFLPWVRNKADDSISRSMASIWIGCPCSRASTSALEQQITIWKDSVEVLQAFPMSSLARP
jgi:zona occludens toxin